MTPYNPSIGYYKAVADELISGTRMVSLNQSGHLQQAFAASPGSRMPAVGVAVDNIASGTVGKVYPARDVALSISGFVGQSVFVGSSGNIVAVSGALNSGNVLAGALGTLLSGSAVQQIGVLSTSGAFIRI